MLAAFTNFVNHHHITNATTFLRSWQDKWDDIPQCDVVLASRSTLVPDLEVALIKMTTKAKNRVLATFPTSPYFIHPFLVEELELNVPPKPTYIYALNILYQLGYNS